jgi:hypothetical protein
MNFDYEVTERAGEYVAGRKVSVGDILSLTERVAAYEVALGSLVKVGASPPPPPIFSPGPAVGVRLKQITASRALEKDDLGACLWSMEPGEIVLTLPKEFGPTYWTSTLLWTTEGSIKVVPEVGATMTSPEGLDSILTKNAGMVIMIVRNEGGEAAEYSVRGDLQDPEA